MATISFLNMNGRTFGQVAPGASQMYGFDHLGSVVQTVDNNGNAQNQYRYHPYGTTESASEPGPAPFHKWVGGDQYRPTGMSYSEYFMKRRHYGSRQASWTSRDPRWPQQRGYAYASCDAVTRTDGSGLAPDPSSGLPPIFKPPWANQPPAPPKGAPPGNPPWLGWLHCQLPPPSHRYPLPPSGPPRGRRPQPKPCLYGNYCGPCNGHNGVDDPIDDLDAACQEHDSCLATWNDWLNKFALCQCRLWWEALHADCHWDPDCIFWRSLISNWAAEGCLIGALPL